MCWICCLSPWLVGMCSRCRDSLRRGGYCWSTFRSPTVSRHVGTFRWSSTVLTMFCHVSQSTAMPVTLKYRTSSIVRVPKANGMAGLGSVDYIYSRCMTARDRLRAWDVNLFGSSNLTHKSCGIFVASWGFAHCIGTRLVFHNFLSHRKED